MTTTTTEKTTDWTMPDATRVLPATAPENQWLKARRNGIGGSDICTITGAATYQTPFEIWAEKTTDTPPAPETNNLFWFGHKVEPLLAERFEDETGLKTRNTGMWANKQRRWAFANPDRLTEDGGILEIKTTTRFTDNGRAYLAGQIPEAHRQQLTWYMMVTGRHTGHIIALVDRDPVILHLEYSTHLAEHLVDVGEKFWECVKTQTPPPVDLRAITPKETSQRWPEADPGTSVEAENTFSTEMLIDTLRQQKARKSSAESQIKECETQLKAMIGDHEYLTLDGRPVARWQTVKPRSSFDKDRALADLAEYAGISETDEEYEDLVDRYTKPGKPSRRFSLIDQK